MRINELNKSEKKILSIEDISRILSIEKESAKVYANRYVNQGLLLRIKKNYYITPEKFKQLDESEIYQTANLLQTPSYISLNTALMYYNISTQQQQNVIESVALKRSRLLKVNETAFRYFIVSKEFYSGFILNENFFIASPAKAFADVVYLSSIGKYDCDFNAIDFRKLNRTEVDTFLKNTNPRTIKYWEKLCASYKI